MSFAIDMTFHIMKFIFIISWWAVKQLSKIPIGVFKCWNYGNLTDLFTFIIYMIVLIINVNVSKIIDYYDFGIFLTGLILIVRWNKFSKYNLDDKDYIKELLIKINRDNKNIKRKIKKQPKQIKMKDVIIEDIPEKPTKPDEDVRKYFKEKEAEVIEITDYKILN